MKAIAIFNDMPKNCGECCMRICVQGTKYFNFCALTGLLLKGDELDVIDGMCPLRPMPEKMNCEDDIIANNISDYVDEIDIRTGWNACIDEILGEIE